MHKIALTLPILGIRLHSFSLTMLLACFGALALTAWRARRERLDPESVYGLSTWLLTGGIIGARAMYLKQHPEALHGFGDLFKIWQGGIVFYGCILGGLIGSLIYWARHPFPFRPMADAVAPALAWGIALGRVGCFLNGCCYGSVTDHRLAIEFPAGSPAWLRHVETGLIPSFAPHSLAVHPTQLYAALDGLLLLALLTAYFPLRRRDGEVMALLMITYPVTRFLNECLRGDEGAIFAGLSAAQLISVGLFLAGLVTCGYLARQPRARYVDSARAAAPDPDPGPVPPPAETVPQWLGG
jgi:phosphatidylglycerol:prolipoprotein diacylglycerol transferase